ncbi:MAG: glycoside hydrolase family 78 protein [Sedimentisphaerales bacterium]
MIKKSQNEMTVNASAAIVLLSALSLSCLGCTAGVRPAGNLKPVELRCEYTQNPLGVDMPHPRLFWKLESATRGQQQSSFQILVASSLENLNKNKGDLWNTGIISSDETSHIFYDGLPLKSSQQVFWKVRVWDKDVNPSPWSKPASWIMGLLNEDDWNARWITSSTTGQSLLLRREFTVKTNLKLAVAHVCGLGQYELSLNGRKASDDILAPGWTKYDKTCLYNTYDITKLLCRGRNVVGLLLGNGMYNVKGGRYTKFTGSFGPLKAICHIRLEYADGSIETVCTDGQWRVTEGPITFCCAYGGEDYDARLQPAGWDKLDYNDSIWQPAKSVDGPGGKLNGLSVSALAIRTFDVLKPVHITRLNPNTTVYDLGQNAAIIPRLTVTGEAGSIVKIIPAELLRRDGSVDRYSCAGGGVPAFWQYTLDGSGVQNWFPKFFYHGCRYLQVVCKPADTGGKLPVVKSLEGIVIQSASPPAGRFACSNELFNRIHTLVRWAQRSNMMSVMTDCPHRERLGWLEELHLNGPSLRYEFDMARLFTKAMNDMADSQLDTGLIPDIAPEYVVFEDGFRDSPEWGSAFVLVPWQQYLWTGDLELLNRHYEGMKRYVAYLGARANDHIVSHGLGDWYDIGPGPLGQAQLTPIALTATAFYYYDAWVLAQTADMLGKTNDAKQFQTLAEQIRDAFNRKFFDPNTGQYFTGSQTANAIPLVMNLVQPENRDNVLNALVQDVQRRGNANTAGDVGYRYMLRALADAGRSDVVFAMNNQSDKPGYGYQLKMGATSLTEAWNAERGSSQNHFMLGQIIEWFYQDLAGIAPDPTGPGFRKIIIRPQPVGNLTWVKAAYDSIYGPITSDWNLANETFTLKLAIPPNTTATVFVPAKPTAEVTESGVSAQNSPGVKFIRQENDRMIYCVGSGRYEFRSRF